MKFHFFTEPETLPAEHGLFKVARKNINHECRFYTLHRSEAQITEKWGKSSKIKGEFGGFILAQIQPVIMEEVGLLTFTAASH